jgi:hypothetical protein
MNYWLRSLWLFSSLIVFISNPVLAVENIEILSPTDKSLVGGKLINIVCRLNKDTL